MTYGIATLSIIPCRAEPSDKAEIISQLLFGEHYSVIEELEKWIKVKNAFDLYEGWICRKQFTEITGKEFDEMNLNEFPLCGSLKGSINYLGENRNITLGATLPYLSQSKISIRDEKASFEGLPNTKHASKLMDYAMMYLNTPYLWGGRSPFGIDCSGFAQIVYKLCGYKLPRDAYQQAGRITHVGIITEPGKIIHASGRVKIDLLDSQGIFDVELKKYTHKLRLIRRII